MTLSRAGLSMAWARALAAAVACTFTGCFTFSSKRPVEVVVTDAATGQPVANAPVTFTYVTTMVLNPPQPASGTTDANGRVVLMVSNCNGGPVEALVAGDRFGLRDQSVWSGGVLTEFQPDRKLQQPKVSVRVVPRRPSTPRPTSVSSAQQWEALDVAGVERAVDAALPLGSSREQVESWLVGQGIGFSYSDRPTAFSQVARLGADAQRYTGVVVALFRDTDRSTLVTSNIQLTFLLGPDGRLARRLVEWVGTGP